jgi:hypothetical protein
LLHKQSSILDHETLETGLFIDGSAPYREPSLESMNFVDLTTELALSSNNIDVNAMAVFIDEITDEDQLIESHSDLLVP